jgi:hypothetical protein
LRCGPPYFFSVTISEKSAVVKNSFSGPSCIALQREGKEKPLLENSEEA